MASPIVNPEVPYVGEIPDGWTAGKMVRIQGIVDPDADRFNINLQTGPNAKPRDDTGLHISVRLNQGYIARNSYIDGTWGDEQGNGRLTIGQSQHFEIIILNDASDFKVAVNGQHFCEFPHRIPSDKITHLLIDGDVHVTVISYEGARHVAAGGETATQASSLQSTQGGFAPQAPPQGGYGPPPQGGYGPPPQGYGPPPGGFPQQGYGGGPGYGPPPAPGAPQQGGFDFMDTAQDILAGAIKTGVAEKLLSGIFSKQEPQGGFQPQNAQYGHYPQPQQQYQQHSQIPQFGGEGSVGGLGSVGGILGSLASSLLNPPKDQDDRSYHHRNY